MNPGRISRGFVNAGGRLVHYRRAGSGPPVVLLHDSPRSSALHLPLLAEFSDAFTVFALDTPGYGDSDPLPEDPRPEIDDFGDALATTLGALGLERPAVYAYHTSSKIALSCATRHPACMGRLVIDGLSLPRDPPPAEFIASYMSPFVPDADGGYIARQWTRIRDLHRFFPWFRREPALRIDMDEPSPEAMHTYAMDLFMAGRHYSSAYAAAMRYRALEALPHLLTPTTFMARANDVLYPFLDAVEAAKPANASVERLPADDDAWRKRLREVFSSARGESRARPAASPAARDFVDVADGQLHFRRIGAGPETVLLLHDPPGSGRDADWLLPGIGGRRVIIPDLPGCGLSDPLPSGTRCDHYAAVLADLLEREAQGPCAVVALGLSVPIAVALATSRPARISRLWLDGMPVLESAEAERLALRYAPAIMPTRDGSHFVATWHRLRDEQLQWPWYDGRRAARRCITPDLDASRLHRRLVATLRQWEHYGDACRAALGFDLPGGIARLDMPIAILDASPDPRYRGAGELAARCPAARLLPRPPAEVAVSALLGEWLAGSGG